MENEKGEAMGKFQSKSDLIVEAMQTLDCFKVPYTVHNDGKHFVMGKPGRQVDFWPTTGTWLNRLTRKRGQGIDGAMESLDDMSEGFDLAKVKEPAGLNADQQRAFTSLRLASARTPTPKRAPTPWL